MSFLKMIKSFLIYLLSIIFLSGCVTLSEDDTQEIVDVERVSQSEVIDTQSTGEFQNIESKKFEEVPVEDGVIFGKTDFRGILKKEVVRVVFQQQENKDIKFQLDVQGETPDYFFLEFPPGTYKISSLSIPVGSTRASEETDVTFEVLSSSIVYLGTLKVIGTKEKIKLGGVPVIQPGFEYEMEILDERDEGIIAFHQAYPNVANDILIKLIQVNGQQELEE